MWPPIALNKQPQAGLTILALRTWQFVSHTVSHTNRSVNIVQHIAKANRTYAELTQTSVAPNNNGNVEVQVNASLASPDYCG